MFIVNDVSEGESVNFLYIKIDPVEDGTDGRVFQHTLYITPFLLLLNQLKTTTSRKPEKVVYGMIGLLNLLCQDLRRRVLRR